jgi:hypothetical protein
MEIYARLIPSSTASTKKAQHKKARIHMNHELFIKKGTTKKAHIHQSLNENQSLNEKQWQE